MKCNSGFFLETVTNGQNVTTTQCTTTNSVANCLEYSARDVCERCQQNFGLSDDKTRCENKINFDANCINQLFPSSLQCSVCDLGFWFDSNLNCVEPSSNNRS